MLLRGLGNKFNQKMEIVAIIMKKAKYCILFFVNQCFKMLIDLI